MNRVDRQVERHPPLEPFAERIDHLLVALDAEQQGDVDVDAVGQALGDGGKSGLRCPESSPSGWADRSSFQSRCAASMVPSVSCASFGETSIETVPSPWPLSSYTGRKTSHAAFTSLIISASTIAVRRFAGFAQRADVLVVVAARRDRLFEDGRVRRHAAQAVVLDQPRQFAGLNQVPRDEIVPDALAEVRSSCVSGDDMVTLQSDQCAHGFGDALRGEAEFLEQAFLPAPRRRSVPGR